MTAEHPIPDARGTNLYAADAELQALLPLYLPADLLAHLQPHLQRLGALAGGVLDDLALAADKHPPLLEHRTRTGIDAQRIVKHPAYVELERVAFSEFGLAALSHRGGVLGWPQAMPAAAKYALSYLFVQAEFGLCCPLSMTDSLARTLRKFGAPALVQRYLPALTTQDFDQLAQGAMFMTEQGAGSDVAATTTRAEAQADGSYKLWGDKWFCSNPDAGLAMVLARIAGAPAGLKGISLFLLPRRRGDGSGNAYRILRLKDKLGTRSMASGEIRFEGAEAWLVGEAGRGFNHMADMINNSRLSNGMRAAGLMRRAYGEALHVATHREAFGRRLVQLPLMRRQLLKLLLPTEQARTMLLQTADALRRADAGEDGAYALTRILTPLIKFRACRDARKVTGDAMEVRGGCGYIEEWSDPRLLRDAHLGSIWEGTSNIVALDVIRAIRREGSLPVLQQHLQTLLDGAELHAAARAVFDGALQRTLALAARVAESHGRDDHAARQAASALYHVSSAVAMAWEATRCRSARRMTLAQLVLRQRVLPQDPLQPQDAPASADELLQPAAAATAAPAAVNLF
ncbi:MAG: acyl-CoA dehydrogenase family protein [Proteobacteria bacterium]|nr:acyl-CoA dehydrogenase family protein [Pseudomonadota bacterium]